MFAKACVSLALCGFTAAELLPRQTPAITSTAASSVAAAATAVTAITACHLHGSELFCMAGETEYLVQTTPTATTDLPAQFTGCHHHGRDMYCIGPDGEDVEVDAAAAEGGDDDHEHDHHEDEDEDEDKSPGGSRHCHFHAGVEHCVGGESSEAHSGAATCEAPSKHYNVGLRVGLLFAILATSAIGVFAPILLQRALPNKLALPLTVLKQFGTGIIISTAFVHCLGELGYESTTSAVVMAGLFLSFCIEFIGHRIVRAKTNAASSLTTKERSKAVLSAEVVSILVMEAGILFHSLLIGLTLVVAGDTFFITLFVVIVFHQLFEGIALGTRIAALGSRHVSPGPGPGPGHASPEAADTTQDSEKAVNSSTNGESSSPSPSRDSSDSAAVPVISLPLNKQLGLAALFAFVTPIGMAIGIGVLQRFNGNDKSTIIAIGTLDALSAGILIWVGVVEMWAADWMVGAHGHKPELADADILTVALACFGLIAGLALMSFLGKWA